MTNRNVLLGRMLATTCVVFWALSNCTLLHAAPAPTRLECPKTLPPDAVAMRERPDGWTQAAPAGYPLDERGVLTGAPDEQAYLMPDRPGEKANSEKWSFHTPHGYQHWVYCKYGSVVMARRISADVKQCVATEDRRSGLTVFLCK